MLIVEPRPRAADALGALIAFWGHQPYLARDWRHAGDVAPRLRPHAVVTEVPEDLMDGWRLAKKLHTIEPEVMLIAVRDWDDAEERTRLDRVGFDHILEKPALFVGLRALLEHSTPAEAIHTGKPLNVFQRLLAWLAGRSPDTSASLS